MAATRPSNRDENRRFVKDRSVCRKLFAMSAFFAKKTRICFPGNLPWMMVFQLAVAFSGCVSQEYRVAQASKETPWSQCQIDLVSEEGETRNAGSLEIFLLMPNEADRDGKGKHENTVYWLEGHTEIKDFHEDEWAVNFRGEKEKEKQTFLCGNAWDILGMPDKTVFSFNQTPRFFFQCEGETPEIFPSYKVQLLDSKGQWFRMDLTCAVNH